MFSTYASGPLTLLFQKVVWIFHFALKSRQNLPILFRQRLWGKSKKENTTMYLQSFITSQFSDLIDIIYTNKPSSCSISWR